MKTTLSIKDSSFILSALKRGQGGKKLSFPEAHPAFWKVYSARKCPKLPKVAWKSKLSPEQQAHAQKLPFFLIKWVLTQSVLVLAKKESEFRQLSMSSAMKKSMLSHIKKTLLNLSSQLYRLPKIFKL